MIGRSGDRRRARKAAAVAIGVAALIPMVAACGGSDQPTGSGGTSAPGGPAGVSHGPLFSECGGVSDQTVAEQTKVTGLVNTAKNSVGCQWLAGGGITGPHFSFSWYRGSPIGRERKTEELSRANVENVSIEGHDGFIAVGDTPPLGASLCEIGIQFGDDFIEWSISFAQKPYPDACAIAKELTRQSIVNAK